MLAEYITNYKNYKLHTLPAVFAGVNWFHIE